MDRELLDLEIGPDRLADRVGGEVPLHRPVLEHVVQRGHDHGLVEHQVAMPDAAGRRVDGVEEAVWPVEAGIESA